MNFLIRPVKAEDYSGLNELRLQKGALAYTMSLPSERASSSQKFVENLGRDDHLFVAEKEGQLIAVAGLHVLKGKQSHVGLMGITVHDQFQGQGIGRAMMEKLLDLADYYLNLLRLELEVVADNQRAINLYTALGFEEEGRKRLAFFRGGKHHDMLVMGRINKQG